MFGFFDPPVKVTIQLLKQMRLKIANDTINDLITFHPDFPSILSISDTLKNFNIDNDVVKISVDEISQLPLPFIAHTKKNYEPFILVIGLNENEFYYLNK